jgi:hypothetical protein
MDGHEDMANKLVPPFLDGDSTIFGDHGGEYYFWGSWRRGTADHAGRINYFFDIAFDTHM